MNYKLKIDFNQLKKQKTALLSIQSTSNSDYLIDKIEGVINLIDNIQDQAVDVHKLKEEDVFNFEEV